MQPFRSLTFALGLAASMSYCAGAKAQTNADSSSASTSTNSVPSVSTGESYKTRPVPPIQTLTPGPFGSSNSSAHPVLFRSQGEMAGNDRDLVSRAQPAIKRSAAFFGFDLSAGNWNYDQIECQALPSQILLLFTKDEGPGDVSLFSAAIPRDEQGRVRLIPIQRRSYSLFSPAPNNPLTISIFNRLRANEPENQHPDWLATALCYAALTGSHPEISSEISNSSQADLMLSFPPTLEVGTDGDSTVRFVDAAANNHPREWALTFDSSGRLLRVVDFRSFDYSVKPVPEIKDQVSKSDSVR